jgi:hypothetical protein
MCTMLIFMNLMCVGAWVFDLYILHVHLHYIKVLAHEPALSRQFLEERESERKKATSAAKPVRLFPDEGLVDPQMAVRANMLCNFVE